jgi:8-oxo-dGTP pyrophosphatase MutT (NUDIX family)
MDPRARFPVAVSNFIFDDEERFLFFSPDGVGRWRVMGGQLETDETIPQCIDREIREELGQIEFRFLDILDAHVFDCPQVGPMLSIFSLLKYESGTIIPASDMEGHTYKWVGIAELKSMDVACPYQFELTEKAEFALKTFKKNEDLSFLKFRWKSLT